jgi:hypothetical protein
MRSRRYLDGRLAFLNFWFEADEKYIRDYKIIE